MAATTRTPASYPSQVLECIADYPIDRICELLPRNVAAPSRLIRLSMRP